MVHPTLTFRNKRTGKTETNDFLLKAVRGEERKLGNKGITITSGRIIAEQAFGFWTELFENHHYKILKGRPIKAFSNLPSGISHTRVLAELTKVRRFRNRINHNEPVCFVNSAIDLTVTQAVYISIQTCCNG